ncbi:MAG: enoyl-CoA hydratase-related protein [Bacteroidota bacterium]|jgi:methylglutaconyl-CoA hydratase
MPVYIDIEDHENIRTIAVNRPAKRNALNAEVVQELQTAFDAAEADDKIRVIVLTGRGGVFCAGADLAYLQQINEYSVLENAEDSRRLMRLMYTIRTSSKATLARVNGHAIAGGCGLALTCDILIAVEDAKFGFTEVRIGFVPAIVMKLLMERCGMGAARELLIRGNLVDAARAKEIGMVNHVVSAERLDEIVGVIAREIATETSPQAVSMTKQLMRDVASLDIADAMSLAAWQNAISRATPDFRTGIESFLKKTKRDWNPS